ncbi:MAG: hypothetical protein JXB32_22470, partial [Deltaproteobacteria bacterium]|nr:hypothetical protein [Deltaproteobacteria bacterium]
PTRGRRADAIDTARDERPYRAHCVRALYHRSRTHLSLGKDAPIPRPIQPPEMGNVVSIPVLGGIHHRDARRAA